MSPRRNLSLEGKQIDRESLKTIQTVPQWCPYLLFSHKQEVVHQPELLGLAALGSAWVMASPRPADLGPTRLLALSRPVDLGPAAQGMALPRLARPGPAQLVVPP